MALTLRAPWFGVGRRVRGIGIIAIVAAIVTFDTPATAQRQADPNALRDLARQFQQSLQLGRTPAYDALIADAAHQARDREAGVQLMYMRESGMPVYYKLFNLNAARTTRTWDVWPLGVGGGFYSLDGLSTTSGELAVWDGGGVLLAHQEFGGRVFQMDVPVVPTHPHSTHVAGTMVAGGVDPTARGMSYQAPLHAYDWFSDTVEMANAAANGLQVSNHSYGFATGWDAGTNRWYGDLSISTVEDYSFGFYSPDASGFDAIANSAPNYLIVVAAGNDRNDVALGGTHQHWNGVAWVNATDPHGDDGQFGGYDTVNSYAVAKNVLAVGAVNDIPAGYSIPADVVQSAFSNWGPCDDGRIKPDIVANGVTLRSAVDTGPAIYGNMSGTSMATPNVSGSVNLIAHEYERRFGRQPLSSTLKAIVINTADEAGPNDGPDYSNGWGLMNTHRAIDLLALHGNEAGGTYESAALQTGEVHEYYFTVDSPQDVRLTLAWIDPAGPVQLPSLDPPTPMLVHDLEVRITHVASGITHMPWMLDRLNPAAAATTGNNTVDNIEQIDIANAPAGEYYVTVTGLIPFPQTQAYSLVWRGMRASQPFDYTSGGGAHIDLGGPGLAPTLHLEDKFSERGAFFSAIRDIGIWEVGFNVAVPFPVDIDVSIYEANGLVRGLNVASVTTTIRHPGEIVHWVPLSVFLRACQDYEIAIRFRETVSLPAWDEPPGGAIPSVEEPFDVGAAVRVRDGTLIGLPADPILPHIVFKGGFPPLQFLDVAPPAPWVLIPGGIGRAGMYVKAQKTFTLDMVSFTAGFPLGTTLPLKARVYHATGNVRGSLLAEGRFLTASAGPLPTLWSIPIEAVLEEGADYDIEVEFPGVGSLESMNETGVVPFTTPLILVADAEADGNPASTDLPHFQLGWTDLAGGTAVDLRKHNDAYPPPLVAPVGAIQTGLYFTSLASMNVHSLGIRADVPAGTTITMRVYEAAGTTRGPLLTEGQVISSAAGSAWHDVPVATDFVAGNGYDIEVEASNGNGWRHWNDNAGMPYTRFGVISVLDAEQGGNPTSSALAEFRINACTSTVTSVPNPTSPLAFSLATPYPNPVTGVATIDFSLDKAETVTIAVYDVAGRRVASLLENDARVAGPGSISLDAKTLVSGIYFVKMQTPTRSVSRKVTIIR